MTQSTARPRKVNSTLAIIYAAVAYLVFVASFLYAIGFLGNVAVPRSVDHALAAPVGEAAAVDSLLLGLFGVQHSAMARPVFKRWWTRIVPQRVERSTYVLVASLVLFLLYWQWRSMPAQVWTVTFPTARVILWALFWTGWATVLATTFMISHLELFGLRQVFLAWRLPQHDKGFRTPLLYRVVRHPMMLGFIVAFWATPTMTAGHLVFALGTTAYILLAVQLEERTLVTELGAPYRDYRRRVPMLLPRPRRHPASRVADPSTEPS